MGGAERGWCRIVLVCHISISTYCWRLKKTTLNIYLWRMDHEDVSNKEAEVSYFVVWNGSPSVKHESSG
ncbi:unnamed protein product [Caretta caretta]